MIGIENCTSSIISQTPTFGGGYVDSVSFSFVVDVQN